MTLSSKSQFIQDYSKVIWEAFDIYEPEFKKYRVKIDSRNDFELRFPIKMAKLANKKNHISFGKANPMQKVSLATGNLLNKRAPSPKKG